MLMWPSLLFTVCLHCSVFTMSQLLHSLHEAGKIDNDMVKTVSDFIAQNQLHTAVIGSQNTVSMAVQF